MKKYIFEQQQEREQFERFCEIKDYYIMYVDPYTLIVSNPDKGSDIAYSRILEGYDIEWIISLLWSYCAVENENALIDNFGVEL